MRNLQFVSRFKVLATKKFSMQNPNLAYDGTNLEQQGLTHAFKMYVPLNDLVTTYTGTTESVVNITDNSLHLIAFTSSVALAPKLNYNARLRFMG